MNFCSVIVRGWKTNIKTVVGILNLFSIIFILTMPVEARDYDIRASDGEVYTVTIGENSDIKDFSVQKSDGEFLHGVTEAGRDTVAELYFAVIFLSDVLPFYEPDDGRSISPQEVLEVVQGALEHQELTQIATVLGSFAVGYLIPDIPIPPTVANLQELNGVTGNLLSLAVLLDAGMLAVECAVEILKHEDLLRALWLSYETRSTIISIDEINTAFESFYKTSLYNSRIRELIDRYFITSIPSALLDFGLDIVPIVSDIKNSISATYNAQHLEDLRTFAENRDTLIHDKTLAWINEAKSQSRIRLEQAGFFQPMNGTQQLGNNAGDTNPNNEVANGVGGTVEPTGQDEPPDDREPPDPPDLVVTNIAVDPDTVYPGERFTVSATVENIGRGRNVSVRFYRSSDSTYSTDDEEITGWHRNLGVLRSGEGPENVHANLDAPMEPGDYYYIVRVDTARDEIKTANNLDSIKITVLPPAAPDLVVSLSVARTKHVEWLSATEGIVDPDKFFRLDATIVNQGQEDSLHTTTVRFYRSLDPIPSLDDDQKIAAETVKKLRDGSDDEVSENGPAPSEPGVYYYFACVDSVPDERSTDNNCSNVVTITVRGPDLIIDSIWPDLATRKDTLYPNGIFEIYATVRNQGTEDASRTILRYYHSSDAIISTDDTQIDEDSVYSLDINQISKENKSRRIYAPYAAGVYYYYTCVDIVEDETHKDNNCSKVISVTVRNIAPQTKDNIATQTLQMGASRTIDVSDYFSDANKDSLTYDLLSNNINVVTLNQTDAKVTINPIGAGDAIVTVVASDGELTAKQTFSVSVSKEPSPIVSIVLSPVESPVIGQRLTLNLNIAGGKAVAGYQATVQFNDTALRFVSGTNGDFLPAGAFFVEPKVEGNLVQLNAASLADEVSGDGILATLTFEVITVTASTLTLFDVFLSSSAGEIFVPQVENAEITKPTKLKGDVNGDGAVNTADLVLVASNLGKTGQSAADVNGDGVVNIADLVLVAGALGTSATAPSPHAKDFSMLTAADVKLWLSQAQQVNIMDATSLQGVRFLEQLLAALTPKETTLLPSYPNPFNPETWIPYQLSKSADVTVTIYNLQGKLIRQLALGHQPAGIYQNRSRAAYWDGKNEQGERVASGVYFHTLTAGEFSATRKMLIRK